MGATNVERVPGIATNEQTDDRLERIRIVGRRLIPEPGNCCGTVSLRTKLLDFTVDGGKTEHGDATRNETGNIRALRDEARLLFRKVRVFESMSTMIEPTPTLPARQRGDVRISG